MERTRNAAGTDRKLLRRLAAGDRGALGELFDIHADRLLGHALWILGRHQDAEDAVQTTFVKLAGLGPRLLGIRSPSAYLGRMVRTEALDGLRARGRRPEEPLAAADLVGVAPIAERSVETRRLAGRVARLPEAQREALRLRLDGFTFREIGKITGVSTATAASRYRLSLERLRRDEDPR